eukprot:NODE_766_length_2109_cov_149.079053_g731_i0.p1 GENE.NODE_766_length_2109_cov_149.079053_g731_i0~~NODE_766_length_2109_cov_149.079053_g731_i0.p1  ORF type:complete len:600 (-),score=123.68 NODE_766_length_2109_cov_149.079053_g731_i0:310-2052(-)
MLAKSQKQLKGAFLCSPTDASPDYNPAIVFVKEALTKCPDVSDYDLLPLLEKQVVGKEKFEKVSNRHLAKLEALQKERLAENQELHKKAVERRKELLEAHRDLQALPIVRWTRQDTVKFLKAQSSSIAALVPIIQAARLSGPSLQPVLASPSVGSAAEALVECMNGALELPQAREVVEALHAHAGLQQSARQRMFTSVSEWSSNRVQDWIKGLTCPEGPKNSLLELAKQGSKPLDGAGLLGLNMFDLGNKWGMPYADICSLESALYSIGAEIHTDDPHAELEDDEEVDLPKNTTTHLIGKAQSAKLFPYVGGKDIDAIIHPLGMQSEEAKLIVSTFDKTWLDVHSHQREHKYTAKVHEVCRLTMPYLCGIYEARRRENELLLFHGTKQANLDPILAGGFIPSLMGKFGPGIYLAENSSVGNLFTDGEPWDPTVEKVMLLCRVSLCKFMVKTDISQPPPESYKAAVVVHRKYREFISYDRRRVYPAYLIRYRVTSDSSSASASASPESDRAEQLSHQLAELMVQAEEIDESSRCKVCLVQKWNTVLGCGNGHVLCGTCAETVTTCPFDRNAITSRTTLHIS